MCVPPALKMSIQSNSSSEDKLHKIVEELIKEAHNLVYIPVIEIEGKDYAYHSKNKAVVFWRRVDHSQKLKENQIEEYETQVIVTHEGYLILELLESEN